MSQHPMGFLKRWLAHRRSQRVLVPLLLAVSGLLGVTSILRDSVTFDELHHLTSGYSYLKTGDFRLASTSPPLAKLWCSWPILYLDNEWPSADSRAWRTGNFWSIGRTWLCELNDGQRLVTVARCMSVLLLIATCLSVYWLAVRLFGAAAGLLALAISAFSPTFLAHGSLVTTDLPVTLGVTLTLLAFARLFEHVTAWRLLAAVLSLAVLSLTKFSWPLVLPAILFMALVVLVRAAPLRVRERDVAGRPRRALALLSILVLSGLAVWIAIWTCFGWRYSVYAADASPSSRMLVNKSERKPKTAEESWQIMLTDPEGDGELGGVTAAFVRWGREHEVLPEGYLYGLLYIRRATLFDYGYLMGEYSMKGWPSYFPIAFLIKTPLAILALAVAGLLAVARGKLSLGRDAPLAIGLLAFTVVFGAAVAGSHLNIGQRHLLPLYPLLFVLSGAAVAWLPARWARWSLAGGLAWLVGASLWIHPHYLAYFNELIGGPAHGQEYLADSNLDWGQDLGRLASWAEARPDETIKLAYFGSADPSAYGFAWEQLLPGPTNGPPVTLSAGTYVVSATSMLGVYDERVRDGFWSDPRNQRAYRALLTQRDLPPGEDASPQERRAYREVMDGADTLRAARLVSGLRHRRPDARIGYSMFVHRLSQSQVDALLAP